VEGCIPFIDSARRTTVWTSAGCCAAWRASALAPTRGAGCPSFICDPAGMCALQRLAHIPFPLSSRVAQGSPLPLLYVLAAQPLAAYIRSQASLGHLQGIPSLTGRLVRLLTNTRTTSQSTFRLLADAERVMQGPIRLFCEASGGRGSSGKAQGLHVGVAEPFSGVHHGTGIRFVDGQDMVRHLGVWVGQGC